MEASKSTNTDAAGHFLLHLPCHLIFCVAQAQRSLVAFTLYIIINFPQLIAGPIIRYRPISDQLEHRSVSFQDFDIGIAPLQRALQRNC